MCVYTVCCNEKRLAVVPRRAFRHTPQTLNGFCVVERLFNECEKLHFSYALISFVGGKKTLFACQIMSICSLQCFSGNKSSVGVAVFFCGFVSGGVTCSHWFVLKLLEANQFQVSHITEANHDWEETPVCIQTL